MVVLTDDLQAGRDTVRPMLALYVGGMGARGKNFYNELARRYGYESEAERMQELYLGGKRREAIAAVPDTLVDDVALVGSREWIAERLDAWRESERRRCSSNRSTRKRSRRWRNSSFERASERDPRARRARCCRRTDPAGTDPWRIRRDSRPLETPFDRAPKNRTRFAGSDLDTH